MSLKKDIKEAINKASAENLSNTPDFILAGYLMMCLDAFESATKERDGWYGVHLEPANSHFLTEEERNVRDSGET